MKISSFKKFIKEEEDSKAIVKTGVNSVGVDNTITREILNSRLANVTRAPFLTPYIALGNVARVLAYASIVVPQYTFLDRDEGEVVFDANQFGKTVGIKIDGTPEDKEDTDYYVYFSYSMNDDGFYDCFAALVDSEGLEKILDMDDDVTDKVDTHQEIEKMHENISEASFENQNVFRPTPSPEQRRDQYRQQRQDRTPQTTPQTSTKSIETPKDRVDRLNRPGYNPPPKTPSRPTTDDRSTREPSSVVPRSDRSTREPSSVVPRSDRSTREPTPAPRNLPPAPRDGEEPSAAVSPMRRSTPAPSTAAPTPAPSTAAPTPRPAAPSTQAQRSEPQHVPGEPQQSAPSRPQAAPRPSTAAPRPSTAAPNYPVYKKDSPEAQSFRDAFGAARKSGQKEFEWQGRKYGTQLAKPSTSAPSQTAPAPKADDSDNKPDVRLPMAPSDQFGKNKITPTHLYNPNTGETKPIQDEKINERKMTKAEMKERERIVRRLKDKMAGFEKRYGKRRAKDVLYATATKMAMEELKGDQHEIDANNNGRIDADDFKKLRGEELKGKQHKIDANNNGRIDADDFKKLRGEKSVDEAMKWDETSSSSLPAKDQDTIKGHEQAHIWHAKMLRQVRMNHDKNPNAETRRDMRFYSNRMAHHNVQAAAMRSQGMKEEPTNPAAQAAQELKDRIAAHKASKPQPVRKPAAAPAPKSEPSVSDAAQKVKAAPSNPAAQELKARIAAHQQTKKK